VSDFNGDDKLDLVVANAGGFDLSGRFSGNGSVSVLLGNGNGTFQPPVNYGSIPGPTFVVAEDFNGDGKPDLAVANYQGVLVMTGNGDGTFQAGLNYGAGSEPIGVAVGDFNGDGKPDLAVANSSYSGGVSVLLNTCVSADPGLAVVRNNNTLTISWPFPSAGFILESVTNLSLTNWQVAPEVPTTNNTRLEVIVPAAQRERYLRLRKP